jgi:transcriptional regulator with XRE-family HTH domain
MISENYIGARIRKARERLGISQGELARRLGKSQNTISSYENGTRTFRVSELPQFAEELEVPIAFFFGEEYPDQEVTALVKALAPVFREPFLQFLREYVETQAILLKQFEEATKELAEQAVIDVRRSQEQAVSALQELANKMAYQERTEDSNGT